MSIDGEVLWRLTEARLSCTFRSLQFRDPPRITSFKGKKGSKVPGQSLQWAFGSNSIFDAVPIVFPKGVPETSSYELEIFRLTGKTRLPSDHLKYEGSQLPWLLVLPSPWCLVQGTTGVESIQLYLRV